MIRVHAVERLRNLYAGETAWIVGKGPSLLHLRAEHFGNGPVITLNQSVLIVQELGLSNEIYSMQKDGCGATHAEARCQRCGHRPPMTYPHEDVTVILQEPNFSEFCLWEHKKRLWVNVQDLGFEIESEMAIRMVIKLAQVMGCKTLVLLCCDSLTNGSLETLDLDTRQSALTSAGQYYEYVAPLVMGDLEQIDHRFITPEAI
jgi:hypothetical protein